MTVFLSGQGGESSQRAGRGQGHVPAAGNARCPTHTQTLITIRARHRRRAFFLRRSSKAANGRPGAGVCIKWSSFILPHAQVLLLHTEHKAAAAKPTLGPGVREMRGAPAARAHAPAWHAAAAGAGMARAAAANALSRVHARAHVRAQKSRKATNVNRRTWRHPAERATRRSRLREREVWTGW